MSHHWRRMWCAALAVALVGSSATACGAGPSSPQGAVSAPKQPPSARATASIPTTPSEQPGWTIVSSVGSAIAVDERSFVYHDGSRITVARFRPRVTRFDLHVGSKDPPTGSVQIPPSAGPSISSAESPLLLAAFNGGFESSTKVGGFEVDGQILSPLENGVASFVIDTNGTGHVGVWGSGLPLRGETITSVRQNLPPLVSSSQPAAQITDVGAWGATLGGGEMVARSALGEDASGDILYAAGMSALPIDLAQALVSSGAETAMELDINPEWVQLALASRPGAPLEAGIPGQVRPADQYVTGWTRDFIAVLAAPNP